MPNQQEIEYPIYVISFLISLMAVDLWICYKKVIKDKRKVIKKAPFEKIPSGDYIDWGIDEVPMN